jgi:hypothetical protein
MPPWLVALLVVSLTIAFMYQLVSGRYGWRVLAYWLLILAGLIGAEVAAEANAWSVTRLGDMRVLPDLAGGLLVVAGLWFLRI